MPNSLFSDFYLSLMFSLKIGPSLGLSCLMSSMFVIIIIIIRITKTTCFDNNILIAELKGNVPHSRWSLSAHNVPNSGYFHEILRTYFQEGSVYF